MRVLRKVEQGETQRNRDAGATSISRRLKKLCGDSEWFRDTEKDKKLRSSEPQDRQRKRMTKKQEERRIESLYFVPLTKEGELRKRLIEAEQDAPFKIKFKYCED